MLTMKHQPIFSWLISCVTFESFPDSIIPRQFMEVASIIDDNQFQINTKMLIAGRIVQLSNLAIRRANPL